MIRMICLDYDNTIFDHRQQKIPESAREALAAVRGKCRVVLASGRFFRDSWNVPLLREICPDGVGLNIPRHPQAQLLPRGVIGQFTRDPPWTLSPSSRSRSAAMNNARPAATRLGRAFPVVRPFPAPKGKKRTGARPFQPGKGKAGPCTLWMGAL